MGLVLFDGVTVPNTGAPGSTAVTVTSPATGSAADLWNRIISLLPSGWFTNVQGNLIQGTLGSQNLIQGPVTGNIGSLAVGPATAMSWIYSLIGYVSAQTRRVTATDGFLDLGLFDFLARRVRRKPSQTDVSTRAMWQKEVLRRRDTRAYVQQAIQDLTGTPASIFEAFNPMDTGGIGAQWAFNEPTSAWGSANYPWTMFINAVQPAGTGIPNLSGLDDTYGGFGAGQFALADHALVTGAITNQDIYDMINFTRAAGITCWVNIGPAPVVGGRLNQSFFLDTTPLA